MKKTISTITILSCLVLASCSAPTDNSPNASDASRYFFPVDNSLLQYKYSQDKLSSSDTAVYKLDAKGLNGGYSQLTRQDQPSQVLFYFKNELAADGSTMCILSNSSLASGFIALKGSLEIGSQWYTDTTQNIQATVAGRYAQYYLPGREISYNDVVVVKYTGRNAASDDPYVLRYFASGFGLILERTITGPSESADLELLERRGGTTTSNPDPNHERWFDANGRFIVHMRNSGLEDK